jgi:hypothetical protein
MSDGQKISCMDYETDLALWADEQAELLREHKCDGIDWEHLAEEIEGLAGRDRREIRSRFTVLIAHLLKQRYQPEYQGRSWQTTVFLQRNEIRLLVEDSPSLRPYVEKRWPEIYKRASKLAEQETGIEMPRECPWTMDEVLQEDN